MDNKAIIKALRPWSACDKSELLHENLVLIRLASSCGSDEPAQLRSLARALAAHIHKVRRYTVKPAFSGYSKRNQVGFNTDYLLNAGQKYCRMLQGEHSAILSTFIKLPYSIKTFVLSIFKWPIKTGFTVQNYYSYQKLDHISTT